MTTQVIEINCVGIGVRVTCEDIDLYRILCGNFEQMRTGIDTCQLAYTVRRDTVTSRINVLRPDGDFCADAIHTGEMIYLLEADLSTLR